MTHQAVLQPIADPGLSCLALVARFHQIAADPQQLRHDYGKTDGPMEAGDLVRCAKRLSLTARIVTSSWERLERVALPALVERSDGGFVVLARVAEDKALIQDPAAPAPTLVSREEFCAAWSGRLVLISHRTALAGAGRRFDLGWFIPPVVRYRKMFAEVLAASFFLQFTALVTPLFFQVVTDKVLVHRGLSSLEVLMVGMAVVSLFDVLLSALRAWLLAHTTSRIDVELGAGLFNHLMGLPLAYFSANPAGTTVARMRELETVRTFLTGSVLTLGVDVLFTFVFFAVMALYSGWLTLIVLATVPIYAALSFAVTPLLRRRLDEKFAHGARNQAFLVESVTAMETLKAMAVEPQMQRRWEGQLAAYVAAGFKVVSLNNAAAQTAQFVNKAMTVLLLWQGAQMVMDGTLSIGGLIAFNMLAGRVSSPILRLAQLWQDVQQVRVSVDRLGDILNLPTERRADAARSVLPAMKGAVTLESVTFRYAPDRPEALRRISLTVGAGESIGLVGSSGSGKSTLTKLIQRLYRPESGRVLVDGVDLASVDTAWLRRQIGVVLQDNVLFSRSVRENIALADPSLPMAAVEQAARLAAAHDFILELPDGYDSVLVERGANLSGGQRQRIAIARALISNPRILIFDEATSALDYESEALIRRNMTAITRGRTVFVIAHRLSAVRHCDRIVVLERGEVVEQGAPDALLKAGGRYAQLWHCQEAGDVVG